MHRVPISTLVATLACLHLASGQNKNDCICVPFYLCTNGTVNVDEIGLVDIRKRPENCKSYLEVCCQPQNTKPETSIRAPTKAAGCGHRNSDGVGYRIKGDDDDEAQFGEFPWMIAVFHKARDDHKYEYKCGGSLIHPQVVLTSAHCITRNSQMRIRAGEWDARTTNEIFKHQDIDVTSATIHQDYNPTKVYNDIALLFLATPIDLTQQINVVCLPPQGTVVVDTTCVVTGWGTDRFDQEGLYQSILKRIEVPVVAHEQCQRAFRQTRLGKLFKLHQSFMCAGGEEGKDACTGDGGGPLVCPTEDEDRYQLIGMVAWGIGCGDKGVPGAYVNVALFIDWIDQQMKRKNFTRAV